MKNAIMIADTRVATIGTLLLQIVEKSPNTFDEAIIYHQDMSTSDQDILQKIMPCVFINYKCPIDITKFPEYAQKVYGAFTLARYDIFDLIKDYNTIAWLDTDIVINKPLDELVRLIEEHKILMLKEHLDDKSKSDIDFVSAGLNDLDVGYATDKLLYSAGNIAISNQFEMKEDYTAWCYEKTKQYAKKILYPDQMILNFLFQEFDIDVYDLRFDEWAVLPIVKNKDLDCFIVHCYGSTKLWNNMRVYRDYPLWGECYHKWVELGGSTMDLPEIEVSVVMPTYNPNLEYFKECLDSLLNQITTWITNTYDNFEIIIIAEPFKTQEDERIFKDFIESYNDDRIIYKINETRMGISASLNQGIRMAKGKYIMRMDDDDIAMPNRMFLQKKYLDENQDIHLVSSDFQMFGQSDQYCCSYEGEFAKAYTLIGCPFGHPTVMLRKDWFEKNDLWYREDYYYVEDLDLWIRSFDKGLQSANIPTSLLRYRAHAEQSNKHYSSESAKMNVIFNLWKKLNIPLSKGQISRVHIYQGMYTPLGALRLYLLLLKASINNKKLKRYDQKAFKKMLRIRVNKSFHDREMDRPIWYAILRMIAKRIKNKTLVETIKQDIKDILKYVKRGLND